jgi:DNA helicase HerA-like ATPase
VLLWILSELFEQLPEVGDPERPRLVFFFDEAHLLWADAPDILRERIEQVVRLIRSKGVGVYFATQNPLDVPDEVLGQLGNRVQHALRAFTPRDQRAVRAAAETFRASPGFDVAAAITQLAVGEALVSFLDAQGIPNAVERALVLPPRSRLLPLGVEERADVLRASPLRGKYDTPIDRESAYELLQRRAADRVEAQPARRGRAPATPAEAGADMLGKLAQSAARAAGSQLGREIMRGVLGSIFGGGGRRR